MDLCMDLEIDLCEAECKKSILEREFEIIPKEGIFLGLDISETSTGVCEYRNGVKSLYNITLETPKTTEHAEVKLRRELKENLATVVKGVSYDLIIIEDAFQGINPVVTRELYALNTAIDELILDGVCTCSKFIRVNNQVWKSWLYTVDAGNLFKGYSDKLRIEECLRLVGISDSGEGYQDRLDATGLIVGYFLCKDKADIQIEKSKSYRFSIGDLNVEYVEDYESVLEEISYKEDRVVKQFINSKTWSESRILDIVSNCPDCIYISSNMVKLGKLRVSLNLPMLEDGGYLMFWVKPKRLENLRKKGKL